MFEFNYAIVHPNNMMLLGMLDNGSFIWSTDRKAAYTFTEAGAYHFINKRLSGGDIGGDANSSVQHVDNVRLQTSTPCDTRGEKR